MVITKDLSNRVVATCPLRQGVSPHYGATGLNTANLGSGQIGSGIFFKYLHHNLSPDSGIKYIDLWDPNIKNSGIFKYNFVTMGRPRKWRQKSIAYACTFKSSKLPNYSSLSWSMLSHNLSEEQSEVGSDGVSDDGRLIIVQCHHYHRPPSSDLYWSSVGILPLLRYHQPNLHSYHCHYQPTPCAIYHSTTTAPPCSTHIPCSRPITSCTHQFSRSWVAVTTRTCEDLVGIPRHPPEYKSPHYMFILLPYALHNNSLYVYVLLLYKYSSLLYVFH